MNDLIIVSSYTRPKIKKIYTPAYCVYPRTVDLALFCPVAGIYIHIPFCRKACNYCNFHFSTTLRLKDDMIAAIHEELEMQKDYLPSKQVETIYLGGGTPSLLSADEILRLTDTISKYYDIAGLKEFTIETNPDDLSSSYINSLKNTTVNRFSIGVQSFYDEDLLYMNRAHNAGQADYAIKATQDAGFTNITIDLIYGTPGLTDTKWKCNLHKVSELGIDHLSAYALTVEENTALHHLVKTKSSAPVDPAQAAHQFETLMDWAEVNNFEQYEISNFATTGHRATHNTNYWLGVPYLGIGPSAHSFDGTNRQWNIANNALYIRSVLQLHELPFEKEVLTKEQRLNEYIMTSLRTSWGIDLQRVTTEWGTDYTTHILKEAEKYLEDGRVLKQESALTLSRKGKLFADGIAADLFV